MCIILTIRSSSVTGLVSAIPVIYSVVSVYDRMDFFTARAYARAVLGVVILSVRLSVCLSVCHTRAL